MEDGLWQDAVAPSRTALHIRKRSASPLDKDYHVSKRPSTSLPRPIATGTFPRSYTDPGDAARLRNGAPGWESGHLGGGAPLGLPANNNGCIFLIQSGPNGRNHNAGVYSTGTGDQHPLSGGLDPFLYDGVDLPVSHLPHTDISLRIPPLQSLATHIASSSVSLAYTTQSSRLWPAPASAHDHTPCYTPSSPATSGWVAPYPQSATHVPLAHDGVPRSQQITPFLVTGHADEQGPAHSEWSLISDRFWQFDPVSMEGSVTYIMQSPPPMSSLGCPPPSDFTLSAGNQLYNPLCPTSGVRRFSCPVMDSNSLYTPGDASKHSPTSIYPSGHQQDPWSDHDSLPFRPTAVSQPYQQQLQQLGPYVEVLRPSHGQQGNAQDSQSTLSDVDERVVADDDQYGIKAEGLRGSISSSDDLQSYSSQSQPSSGSWLELSSPESFRHDDSKNPIYSRSNSVADLPLADGFTLVPENPGPPDRKSKRKNRRPFDSKALYETNRTRMRKACVACRKQKVRCQENEDDPSAPCKRCRRRKDSSSGKIIHRTVCVRTLTVSSIRIIRQGGLGLTRRWEGTKMMDVTDWPADSVIKPICMLQGLIEEPIVVNVRKFTPTDGDVTSRPYNYQGSQKSVPLEPYCLASIHDTANYFSGYLSRTAVDGLKEAAHKSGPLVRDTYAMIHEHAVKLMGRVDYGLETGRVKEKEFFLTVIKLVWCMRHTTGSVWLGGKEKLGMEVPQEEGYPLQNPWTGENEVMLPRMIVAQFDSIQNERILPSLLKRVLTELESYLSSCKDEWFTMYLAVFMLLHEISVASQDRYRWACDHQQKARYGGGKYASLGMYVENFQKASHPLLAYWHYYKVDELDSVDWNALGKTKKLKHLEPNQVEFMRKSMLMLRDEEKHIPNPPACWEHELFFVSHMFKQKWDVGYQTFNFMDE